MRLKMTKAELAAEQAAHPGLIKYETFRVESGVQELDGYFWAKDEDEARAEFLRRYPDGLKPGSNAYFGEAYRSKVGKVGSDVVDVADSFETRLFADDSDDKDKDDKDDKDKDENEDYDEAVADPDPREMAVGDIGYFIEHYDPESRSSHSRTESWSLDQHILGDIEFNVPIIIRTKKGVPDRFCQEAKKQLGCEFGESCECDDEALRLAEDMWNGELRKLLGHVWMYEFFSGFGVMDGKWPTDKTVYLSEKKDLLPYKPGMYRELDYAKLSEMAQAEWNAVWKWMAEYGQSLWT